MQERKEKALSSPSSLLPACQCRSLYCLFLGFFLFTVPSVASPGLCPHPLVGMWQRQCSLLYGTEFRHLPRLGAGGGGRETCQVHPNPRSSRDYPCSAGLTGALAGDLRVQSKWQEQSKVKPFRGAMEKQPETAWP